MGWLEDLQKTAAGLQNKAARAYGQFDKNYAKGLLPGGAAADPVVGGKILAAQEAIPAIARGALRLGDGEDRSVDPRMQKGLVDAYKASKAAGMPHVHYNLYDDSTAGGYGAKHTFGNVPYSDIKLNDQGEVVGLKRHAYDTDKTPEQLKAEIANNGPDYKRAELMLSQVQGGGINYHNLDFGDKFTSNPSQGRDSFYPESVPVNPQMRAAGDAITGNPALNDAGPATAYAVKAGDTLSSIAAANNTTVAELAKKNNIADVNMIGVGQNLKF